MQGSEFSEHFRHRLKPSSRRLSCSRKHWSVSSKFCRCSKESCRSRENSCCASAASRNNSHRSKAAYSSHYHLI